MEAVKVISAGSIAAINAILPAMGKVKSKCEKN